jgi:hypothetical protein
VDSQAGAQVAGGANQIADVPVAALHSESSQAVYRADLLLYRGNSSASVCSSYTSGKTLNSSLVLSFQNILRRSTDFLQCRVISCMG